MTLEMRAVMRLLRVFFFLLPFRVSRQDVLCWDFCHHSNMWRWLKFNSAVLKASQNDFWKTQQQFLFLGEMWLWVICRHLCGHTRAICSTENSTNGSCWQWGFLDTTGNWQNMFNDLGTYRISMSLTQQPGFKLPVSLAPANKVEMAKTLQRNYKVCYVKETHK